MSTYDASGNVLTQQTFDSDGTLVSSTTNQYDEAGNLVRTVDGDGITTIQTFDAAGHVLTTQVIGLDGGTTSSTYDESGNLIRSVDADGNYTMSTYDAAGNVLTQDTYSPGGGLVSSVVNTYDEAGNLITSVDGDGNTTTSTYDAAGRQLTAQVRDGTGNLISSVANTYDEAGNLIQSVDGVGNYTVSTYDANGNVLTQNSYDANGTLISSSSSEYDEAGNLIKSIDGGGNVTEYTYDAQGNKTSETVGAGTSAAATTQYFYDESGNLIKLIDPTGNTTEWTYDAVGQKVSMTDSAGHTATWQYDQAGRLTTYIDRDGRKQTYQYDANGNLTQETWYAADGTVGDTLDFGYDDNGNLLSASNANASYTFTYNADGNIATMQGPFGLSLAYGYDENGNLTSVADSAGGTTTCTYDGNQLVGISFSDGSTTAGVYLTYDEEGNLTNIVRYGDSVAPSDGPATTTMGYDGGNLTSIVHTGASSATIASFAYSFDLAGQLTSETDNGTTTNYSYDPTGQLIQAGSQTYSFDVSGNPTGSGVQIGPDNELLSNGTFDFTYDAEGNEISKTNIATGDKWAYAYNNANELIFAVESASDGTIEKQVAYQYDAFGNLIEEDVSVANQPTSVTQFALGWTGTGGPSPGTSTADVNWRVWGNLDGNGSLTSRFLNGAAANQVFAEMADGNIDWLLADHESSVRDVVDNTGNVLDAIAYDPFGNITSQFAPAIQPSFAYAGYRFDAGTGLYDSRARDYDPVACRWLSQDPVAFEAGDANLYRYVSNAPTTRTDPSGLDSIELDHRRSWWNWFGSGTPTGQVSWKFDDGRYVNIGRLIPGEVNTTERVQLSEEYGGGRRDTSPNLTWIRFALRQRGVNFSELPAGQRAAMVKLFLEELCHPGNRADIEAGRFYGMFGDNTAAGALFEEFPATLRSFGASVATDLAVNFVVAPALGKALNLFLYQAKRLGKGTYHTR